MWRELRDYTEKLVFLSDTHPLSIYDVKERLKEKIDKTPFEILFDYENGSRPVKICFEPLIEYVKVSYNEKESEIIEAFIYNNFVFNSKTFSVENVCAWGDWGDDVDIYMKYLYGEGKKVGLKHIQDLDKVKRSLEESLKYTWKIYDEIYEDLIDEDPWIIAFYKESTIDVIHDYIKVRDLNLELSLRTE